MKTTSVTHDFDRNLAQPLIRPDGQPRWGRLQPLPTDINWKDYDWRNAMGAKRAAFGKQFGFKHFEFFGIQTPQIVFGSGLVRLGLVNLAFAYVFDKKKAELSEWSRLSAFDQHLRIDTRPKGHTSYQSPDATFDSRRTPAIHQLAFTIGAQRRGRLSIHTENHDVVGLCTPIANTGFAYAQKTAGMPVEGFVNWDGKVYPVDPKTAGCCHDWTAGYLRRETFWKWVCISGVLGNGQTFCLNASCGVNETSHSENGYWIDGQFTPIGLVEFDYDRDRPEQSMWTITSNDGRLQLRFKPAGSKKEHQNRLVMASRFTQCFGEFSGHLVDRGDDLIDLGGLWGWCEDHYAKW